ncbi:MAG TPA: hypothetical protein PLX15_04620 [Candidatus Woesearchaeota archaeon]|nr:hypothetical protein [Candidatus Woesearchaeota archaeon]
MLFQKKLEVLSSKKKSQAAMEYVMTYGWAILAVMIVIGFIVNYANIDPSDFMGEECNFDIGLKCNDFAISESGANNIVLSVTNGFPKAITITKIVFSGGFSSTHTFLPSVMSISPTDTKLIKITAGTISPFRNKRVEIEISYYYDGTPPDDISKYTYTLKGYLVGSSAK